MNDKIGLVSFPPNREAFAERPYSDETAQMIDAEVREFVAGAYTRTVALLTEKRELVEAMAQELLTKEVLGLDAVGNIAADALHFVATFAAHCDFAPRNPAR